MNAAAFGEADPHSEPICKWVLDEDNRLVARWSVPQDSRAVRAHQAMPRPRHRPRMRPRSGATRP